MQLGLRHGKPPRQVGAELVQFGDQPDRVSLVQRTLGHKSPAGFPGLRSGECLQYPEAELLSDGQLAIDWSLQTRSPAARMHEARRCCPAKPISRRANGRVLLRSQRSQSQEDCAWTVRFGTAN